MSQCATMIRFFIVFCVLFIFGCAHGNNTLTGGITAKSMKESVDKGNTLLFSYALSKLLDDPVEGPAFIALLQKYPETRGAFVASLKGGVEAATNTYKLNNMAAMLKQIETKGFLPEAKPLLDQIYDKAQQSNENGSLAWDLSSVVTSLPPLQTRDARQIMFVRTLSHLRAKSRNTAQIEGLVNFLQSSDSTDAMREEAFNVVSELPLDERSYKILQSVYPEFAKSKLESFLVYYKISTIPHDPLLEDDITKRLLRISEHFKLAEGKEDNKKVIFVTIEKLRHEERTISPQTETITYPQYQVNLAAAALLMPRNASYMFDLTTGGIALEYGYAVRVVQNGVTKIDELLRGELTKQYETCSNARIVNVFGGVSKAEFIANDDMASRCSGSTTTPPTMNSLREELFTLLINKIK